MNDCTPLVSPEGIVENLTVVHKQNCLPVGLDKASGCALIVLEHAISYTNKSVTALEQHSATGGTHIAVKSTAADIKIRVLDRNRSTACLVINLQIRIVAVRLTSSERTIFQCLNC